MIHTRGISTFFMSCQSENDPCQCAVCVYHHNNICNDITSLILNINLFTRCYTWERDVALW